jgi:hypothetical protein
MTSTALLIIAVSVLASALAYRRAVVFHELLHELSPQFNGLVSNIIPLALRHWNAIAASVAALVIAGIIVGWL